MRVGKMQNPKSQTVTVATIGDSVYDNVTLHAPMNGVFQDLKGHSFETVGNPTPTANKKFGTSAVLFDGTSCINYKHASDFNFGSADFTVEFWLFVSASPTVEYGLFTKRSNLGYSPIQIALGSTGQIWAGVSTDGTTWKSSGSLANPTLSVWTHIAFVRSNDVLCTYVNGIPGETTAITGSIMTNTAPITLGASSSIADFGLIGAMDEIRITNGVARYTAWFQPDNMPGATFMNNPYTTTSMLKTLALAS